MNIKTVGIITLILVLAGFGYWIYSQYQDYQKLKLDKQITEQNNQALKDSNNVKSNKITILTTFVFDLKFLHQKDLLKNIALESRISILIDSLKIRGQAVTVVSDSGDTVKFFGKQGIALFDGFTFLNRNTKISNYSLSLNFPDPILVKSYLFEEDATKLWKIKTESLTEGIKVLGISTLDEETFNRLQKYKQFDESSPSSFGLNLSGSKENVYIGTIFNVYHGWYVDLNYRLNNKETHNEWFDKMFLGLHLFLF